MKTQSISPEASQSVAAALRGINELGPDHWRKVSKRWMAKAKRNLKAGNRKGKWEAAHDLDALLNCLAKWAAIERPKALTDLAEQASGLLQSQIAAGADARMNARLDELNLNARIAQLGA